MALGHDPRSELLGDIELGLFVALKSISEGDMLRDLATPSLLLLLAQDDLIILLVDCLDLVL